MKRGRLMAKKLLALLLCAALTAGLAACGGFDLASLLRGSGDWDNTPVAESKTGSPFKYYFSQLDNKGKQAYNNILENAESMAESIEVPYLSQNELNTVFEAVLYDNPQLFFLGRSCSITVKGLKSYFVPDFLLDAAQYAEMKAKVEAAADKIIRGIPKGADDFTAELAINDAVVEKCSYSGSGDEIENTVYGSLIDGKATCEGYAKAVKLLADKAGIDCYVIAGMSKSNSETYQSHMWNVIRIGGDWYNLDATWNDPVNEKGVNEPRRTYFNLTDEEIGITHKDFSSANKCTATAENYFVRSGLLFDRFGDKEKQRTARAIAGEAGAGKTRAEIKFTGRDLYADTLIRLFEKGGIYDILEQADRQTKKYINTASVSYIENPEFNIIEIIFKVG